MLNGTEINAALTSLEPFPIDVIGMNCGTGPKHMTESSAIYARTRRSRFSVLPNAGLPESRMATALRRDAGTLWPRSSISPAILASISSADAAARRQSICGMVVESLSQTAPKHRNAKLIPSVSSIYLQQPYKQDASFLIVGERVNASGSKKMRDLLDAEDWDGWCLSPNPGTRRRAYPGRQRRFCRPRRRKGYARTRVSAGYGGEDSADVRLDRVAKDGSGPRTRRRQIAPELNKLRGR